MTHHSVDVSDFPGPADIYSLVFFGSQRYAIVLVNENKKGPVLYAEILSRVVVCSVMS